VRVYQNWRWNYNTGGGQLMDWIGHHGDIAHWGWDSTAPGRRWWKGTASSAGERGLEHGDEVRHRVPVQEGSDWLPGGRDDDHRGGSPAIAMGTKWIGTDGWVWVDRSGFDASNPEWVKEESLPESERKVQLIVSNEHRRNFLDSVRSRKPTIAPVETAHHSTIPGIWAYLDARGRKIEWDVKKETILNDPGASALLTRPYREPWKLS